MERRSPSCSPDVSGSAFHLTGSVARVIKIVSEINASDLETGCVSPEAFGSYTVLRLEGSPQGHDRGDFGKSPLSGPYGTSRICIRHMQHVLIK